MKKTLPKLCFVIGSMGFGANPGPMFGADLRLTTSFGNGETALISNGAKDTTFYVQKARKPGNPRTAWLCHPTVGWFTWKLEQGIESTMAYRFNSVPCNHKPWEHHTNTPPGAMPGLASTLWQGDSVTTHFNFGDRGYSVELPTDMLDAALEPGPGNWRGPVSLTLRPLAPNGGPSPYVELSATDDQGGERGRWGILQNPSSQEMWWEWHVPVVDPTGTVLSLTPMTRDRSVPSSGFVPINPMENEPQWNPHWRPTPPSFDFTNGKSLPFRGRITLVPGPQGATARLAFWWGAVAQTLELPPNALQSIQNALKRGQMGDIGQGFLRTSTGEVQPPRVWGESPKVTPWAPGRDVAMEPLPQQVAIRYGGQTVAVVQHRRDPYGKPEAWVRWKGFPLPMPLHPWTPSTDGFPCWDLMGEKQPCNGGPALAGVEMAWVPTKGPVLVLRLPALEGQEGLSLAFPPALYQDLALGRTNQPTDALLMGGNTFPSSLGEDRFDAVTFTLEGPPWRLVAVSALGPIGALDVRKSWFETFGATGCFPFVHPKTGQNHLISLVPAGTNTRYLTPQSPGYLTLETWEPLPTSSSKGALQLPVPKMWTNGFGMARISSQWSGIDQYFYIPDSFLNDVNQALSQGETTPLTPVTGHGYIHTVKTLDIGSGLLWQDDPTLEPLQTEGPLPLGEAPTTPAPLQLTLAGQVVAVVQEDHKPQGTIPMPSLSFAPSPLSVPLGGLGGFLTQQGTFLEANLQKTGLWWNTEGEPDTPRKGGTVVGLHLRWQDNAPLFVLRVRRPGAKQGVALAFEPGHFLKLMDLSLNPRPSFTKAQNIPLVGWASATFETVP